MSSKKKRSNTKMTIRRGSTSKQQTPPEPQVDVVNPFPTIAFASKSKNKFKTFKEEMEKESNLTLKERFDIFVSETSFTALTKIFKARNIAKSIAWLILTITMIAWLCIQCYWLFTKYLSYPYEVNIEKESVPQMQFPSVTICNRNPVKKSKFDTSPFKNFGSTFTLSQDASLFDKALAMMKNGSTPDNDDSGGSSGDEDRFYMTKMINQSFNVWEALNDPATAQKYYNTDDAEIVATMTYARIAAQTNESELKSYGHQIDELLVSCRFAGMPCSPQNFTYVHNVKYGNCYTFNAFNNSKNTLHSSYAGPLMGFTLELNVQQNEYISALAPDAGVRVLVHARGTYPAVEDNGVSIPVGTVTSIGLSTTELSRLTPPHSTCATEGKVDNIYQNLYGTRYEKATCVKSCQQYIWKEKCGCVLPLYAVPDNTSICDVKDLVAQACLLSTCNEMQECELKCPNPCSETKYEPLISMGSWPSKEYEDYMDFKLTHMSLDFMSADEKPESEENMAKLEVYFRELVVEKIEQKKAYESQNLISDVGGQLGLWLGLSAITIGEMVEFFMAIFKAITARAVRRRHKETAVESFDNRRLSMSMQELK